MEENDPITQYTILAFIVAMTGWLMYNHTGSGPGDISPDFWTGVVVGLFVQLARKTFNLKGKNGNS